jgi:hypothetical protein
MFAHWAIVFFAQFFLEKYKSGLLFFHGKSYVLFLTNMGWATFLANF